MSTTPNTNPPPGAPAPVVPPAPPPPKEPGRIRSFLGSLFVPRGRPGELVSVGHSNLFYWWPVWLTGFILAGLTWFADTHMALVPADTKIVTLKKDALPKDAAEGIKGEEFEALVPQKGEPFPRARGKNNEEVYKTPYMHPGRGLGLVFLIILLVVIMVTNVPLRGLWSFLIIMVLVLGSVIFAQAGWWDAILRNFQLLAIHINLAGYLFFSLVLFGFWLFNFLFFDRQVYMIFTPGQVRVRLEIGGGETAYETTGMVFQKQRSDLFRHWVLGFGSGDLIIRPAQTREAIDMHNVMNVGRRVRQIEMLLKEREVVAMARA
jgi:hypothetical protein